MCERGGECGGSLWWWSSGPRWPSRREEKELGRKGEGGVRKEGLEKTEGLRGGFWRNVG